MKKNENLYAGLKQCSNATGISPKMLRLAKTKDAPGFRLNNSINMTELKPWLDIYKDKLQAEIDAFPEMDELKKESLQKDIEKKTLEIQKLKKLYLDPTEVKEFLTTMSVVQSSLLKSMIVELPARCVGKTIGEIEKEVERSVSHIFILFKSELSNFIEKEREFVIVDKEDKAKDKQEQLIMDYNV